MNNAGIGGNTPRDVDAVKAAFGPAVMVSCSFHTLLMLVDLLSLHKPSKYYRFLYPFKKMCQMTCYMFDDSEQDDQILAKRL